MISPIRARSTRRPRRKGVKKGNREGEARRRERESGKDNRKSAEYSRTRRKKAGRKGLKSVWR